MKFGNCPKTLGKIQIKEQQSEKIAIKSKGKGKSGGARVITNFVIADGVVYLLSIYDKSDKENLTDKELEQLLKHIPQ